VRNFSDLNFATIIKMISRSSLVEINQKEIAELG